MIYNMHIREEERVSERWMYKQTGTDEYKGRMETKKKELKNENKESKNKR